MIDSDALEVLAELAWIDPAEWKRHFPGRKMLGVFGPCVPWESILAGGYEPVFLFPENLPVFRTRQVLPPFACHVSRTVLDYVLRQEKGNIDAFLFIQSCDAIQAVADIASASVTHVPVHFFALPRLFSGEPARRFYRAELNALEVKLGKGSEEEKKKASEIFHRTRELLNSLYRYRQAFTAFQFYSLLRAVHLLPKDYVNRQLEKLLAVIDRSSAVPVSAVQVPAASKPRLFLVGSHLPGRLILEAIDTAGAEVTGEMIDLGLAVIEDSPFEGEPIPGTHRNEAARRGVFIERFGNSGARGVLFYRQKYCDPHGFDITDLGSLCRSKEIPFLILELDRQSDSGRISTRLEAFLEILVQYNGAAGR